MLSLRRNFCLIGFISEGQWCFLLTDHDHIELADV